MSNLRYLDKIRTEEIDTRNYIIIKLKVDKKNIESKIKFEQIVKRLISSISLTSSNSLFEDCVQHDELMNFVPKIRYSWDANKDNPELFEIGIPLHNFDKTGGLTHIWTIMIGEIFIIHTQFNAQILDIHFPNKLSEWYKGPNFGFDSLKNYFDLGKEPMLCTVIEPSIGMKTAQYAKVADQFFSAGSSMVSDLHLIVNPDYCPIIDRTKLILEKIKDHENKTGKKALYFVNMIGNNFELMDIAREISRLSEESGLLIGIRTSPIIQNLDFISHISSHFKLPILTLPHSRGLFAQEKRQLISPNVIIKMLRILGSDFVYLGAEKGRFEWQNPNYLEFLGQVARSEFLNMKPSIPIITGGINVRNIDKYIKRFGNQMQILVAGAIYEHPQSTFNNWAPGVKAFRQAFKIYTEDIDINEILHDPHYKEFSDAFRNIKGEYKEKSTIFLSYSIQNSQSFSIREIAAQLSLKDGIKKVLFWEGWTGFPNGNIIQFMENGIAQSQIFIPFFSPEYNSSTNCKKEYETALAINKNVIPVFRTFNDVSLLCRSRLGVDLTDKPVLKVVDEIHRIISGMKNN